MTPEHRRVRAETGISRHHRAGLEDSALSGRDAGQKSPNVLEHEPKSKLRRICGSSHRLLILIPPDPDPDPDPGPDSPREGIQLRDLLTPSLRRLRFAQRAASGLAAPPDSR